MILVGDIGGTKTVIGLCSEQKTIRTPLLKRTFASANYDSLDTILAEFTRTLEFPVDKAFFGVAGPVIAGKATITNLPWSIDENNLKKTLGVSSVKLINDLEAIAWSIPMLKNEEICSLNPQGEARSKGVIAAIAPGTGLGEAYLAWDKDHYQPYPSEGGHSDFAPTNELEIDLLRYLLKKFDHVSYERVCSGSGIPNIYSFLKESGREQEPEWLRRILAKVSDPTPAIINTAKEKPCPICKATLKIFTQLLGAETGNMALKLLPTGGIYLGGGIPPRIVDYLQDKDFLDRFFEKGRIAKVLTSIPVNIIVKPDAALTGIIWYATMTNRA